LEFRLSGRLRGRREADSGLLSRRMSLYGEPTRGRCHHAARITYARSVVTVRWGNDVAGSIDDRRRVEGRAPTHRGHSVGDDLKMRTRAAADPSANSARYSSN